MAVVLSTEDGMEGLGLSIQNLAEYLYADDGLFTSTQTEMPQRAFDVLAKLFNRVGFWTNSRKTVSMACQP